MAEILHMVKVNAPSERVYSALTEQKGLEGWWTRDASAEPKVGSKASFGFGQQRSTEMKISELKRNRLVHWKCVSKAKGDEWTGTELFFELKPDKQGTIVVFSHRKWKRSTDFLRYCSAKWAVYLVSLKNYVEVGKGSPWPHDIQTW